MRATLCVAVSLFAGGCSAAGAGTFAPSGAPATIAVSRAAPRLDERPAILAAYRVFHRVFEQTVATNRPDEIGQVATGRIAAHLDSLVRSQRRHHLVLRGHAALHPQIAWIKDGTALVVDCVVTAMTPFDARSGRRLGPTARPRPLLLEATMRRETSWRLADLTTRKDPAC
jgi:hypothetical protein